MESFVCVKRKKDRGQTTIEFLMIFLMVLTFVELVVNPVLREAGEASLDAKNAAQVVFSAKQLANAIAEVSVLGNSGKESKVVFLPDKTVLRCDKDGAYQCEAGEIASTCAGNPSCSFPKILFQINTETKNVEKSSKVKGCLDGAGEPAGKCCGFVPVFLQKR
jgi:hypothetical protein